MKRHLLSTIAAASLAGLSFTACDKKPDASTPPPSDPAAPSSTVGTGATPAPGKTAEPVKPAVVPVVAAPPAEVAKIASNYGFIARLPKDTEGFSSIYRLYDLWLGLSKSKWAETLMNLPPVKDEMAMAREQWDSPDGKMAREIIAGVLGEEISIAVPGGFTAKLKAWEELFTKAFGKFGLDGFLRGSTDPEETKARLRTMIPEIRPLFAKCEALPVVIAIKAGKIRPMIEEGNGKLKTLVKDSMPMADLGHFKFADKYEFDSITVTGQRLMASVTATQLELELTDLLGNEAEAKKVLGDLMAKRLEVAWGWVDDYLVVTVGPDHSHLKLAPSEAESALSIAEVGRRATQFAEKKPNGLSYISKMFLDAFTGKLEFANWVKSGTDELVKQQILLPDQAQAMVSDVRNLESKAQKHFETVNDSSVQVDFWDAGLRSEIFGGSRLKGADASKPLTFSPLATASTLLFVNNRTNGAYSTGTNDLIEEAVTMVVGWYEKYGKKFVPEEGRTGANFIETAAFPAIREFWKHSRTLGKAFGDESAFLFDTAGTVPEIEGMPPFLKEGKIPRLALVMELKNRAALGEAWAGYFSLIKQLATLQDIELTEPKKGDGPVEMYYLELPIPTGDVLPHVAFADNRWILSSSPSFTKELVAKAPKPTGAPTATQISLNMGAIYDFADVWLKVMDKNGEQTMPPEKFEEFKKNRPMVDAVLKLARSWEGVEWRLSEEGGQKHHSLHLKLHDLK